MNERKSFIDNLRWMDVFLLIPYHAAQSFNTWGELNYIFFTPDKFIASFIVFFSPFFMPVLFLLAGMSTKYALEKRTYKQFVTERVKRLLVPFATGTLVFCPVLSYIGDKTNFGYEGNFFEHYKIFFTKWTDLSGFDGGFNVGQFWFLYYLFIISLVSVGIIVITRHVFKKRRENRNLPFWAVCLFAAVLPFLYDVLAVGGKSFAEYLFIFLSGYFIFADDHVIVKAQKCRWISFAIGFCASVANVYMFVWSGKDFGIMNVVAKSVAEWFMILALLGIGKKRLDFKGKASSFMSRTSFAYFSFHFIWIVLFQYWFSDAFIGNIVLLYFIPVLVSYAVTFFCSIVSFKIPFLSFLMGAKSDRKK